MLSSKEKYFKSKVDDICIIIDDMVSNPPNSFHPRDFEERIGFSLSTLHKYMKKYIPEYDKKLTDYFKKNRDNAASKCNDQKLQKILDLSKEGKGIDTISTLVGLDSISVRNRLKKLLGEEEYKKRHFVGRKGGRFGKTYELPNGQIVQSLAEYKIGIKLIDANIRFETQKELVLSEGDIKRRKFVDFYLIDFQLYIEYAGMMDWDIYERQVKAKIDLYRLNDIRYIYIYKLDQAIELITFLLNYKSWEDIDKTLKTIQIPLSKDRIFYTLQAEAKNTGVPAVFVRMSYCNLHCVWCDSFYTWMPEYVNHKERPDFVSIQKIYEEIIESQKNMNTKRKSCFRVVLTGGEPLSFQKQLEPLVYLLLINGYDVEIETNGTIIPSPFLSKFCQFNVSPKLSNNLKDSKEERIKPSSIVSFKKNKNAIFKFVVKTKDDWKEVEEDYIIPFSLPKNRIYLMPQASTREELYETLPLVIELCVENDVIASNRLQVLVWGNKRRV